MCCECVVFDALVCVRIEISYDHVQSVHVSILLRVCPKVLCVTQFNQSILRD